MSAIETHTHVPIPVKQSHHRAEALHFIFSMIINIGSSIFQGLFSDLCTPHFASHTCAQHKDFSDVSVNFDLDY